MTLRESRPKEIGNTLSRTEIRHVRSEHVGDEFRLTIGLPPAGQPPGARLPVIYALDGNLYGSLAIAFVRAQTIYDVPPGVVVAIGYPIGAIDQRCRDYMPTRNADFDERTAKIASLLRGTNVEPVVSGGAPAFLRFIQDELKPFIEAEYGGDPEEATISGLSAGGLFGAWVLFNETAAFRRYHIVSPALWWDDQHVIKQEAAHFAAAKPLKAKVFLGEAGLAVDAVMQRDFERAAKTMPKEVIDAYREMGVSQNTLGREVTEPFCHLLASRNYEGLELTTHVFEGETHTSSYAPALSYGFRKLFGTYEA